jgi:AcrR family transcriptional regulator
MGIETKAPEKEPVSPESRSAKVDAIERAAFQLFHERGYGHVSMDEIARSAGVSKATIYSHFADKAELFASLVRTGCAMTWVRTELEGRRVEDYRAVLIEVAESYVAILSEKGPMTRMVIAEAPRFPEMADIFFTNGPLASRGALGHYLERVCAAGLLSISDCDQAAGQFFALLRDDIYLRLMLGLPIENPEEKVRKSIDAAVDMFLRAARP